MRMAGLALKTVTILLRAAFAESLSSELLFRKWIIACIVASASTDDGGRDGASLVLAFALASESRSAW